MPIIFNKISQHSLPTATAVRIICGNCAGDEMLPVQTNLTSAGACAVCGGHSFVIASRISEALARHIQSNRTKENYEQQNKNTKTIGNLTRVK